MNLHRFTPRILTASLPTACVLAISGCSMMHRTDAEPAARPFEQRGAYIIEANSVSAARTAVEEAGGNVTRELRIIDAVAADLSERQRRLLSQRADIRGVFPDAAVEVSSTTDASSAISTVADRFESVSYGNDDGSHRWAGPWTETGDDGGPLAGKISISLNPLPGLTNGRLILTGSGAAITRSAAIAPGALQATLRFDVQRVSLESNDFVSVQASRDGIVWTEIGRISGPANDRQPWKATFDVSPFISADTGIRLVTGMNMTLLNWDAVQIDNLELAYDSVYATGVSYPSLAGADKLHQQGITGLLVTVAVLDTGYWKHPDTDTNSLGLGRVLAQYDAMDDRMDSSQLQLLGATSLGAPVSTDTSGHGSHVSAIILNNQRTSDGRFFGVAPDANLVSVRAFDSTGRGTYSSVIRGIDWVVQNKDAYNIRVLNLSLGAAPVSHYWDDPLNRAVMQAWRAGIAVVASAGNTGPAAQTITVPGNVPYVITVGAMTDNYTPANPADDRLTSFSAAGPTYEGFVKPELVAPGGHIWSLMPTYASIAQAHPTYQNDGDFFTMSGTSQAAAVTSGVVALLLQAQPGLTPDQVKCKLISSARPAVDTNGEPAYTVFQQGAGLINAAAARNSNELDCANRNLDIDADLAGTRHYGGPARQDEDGDYYVADSNGDPVEEEGYAWDQGYTWNQGYAWDQSYTWDEGYTCNQGYTWSQSADDWNDGDPWSDGSAPDTASSMSINAWVAQE